MCKLIDMKTNTGDIIQVADIRKDIIEKIIDIAKRHNVLDYIILFGSCLEERCTENSDIDLALVSSIGKGKMLRSSKLRRLREELYDISSDKMISYDFIYFKSLEEMKTIKHGVAIDIVKNGKIIYERMG